MKPTHLITLMTALAAGSALAATAPTVSATKGTNAGTVITNVATATFDDPTTGNPLATPISSNAVTTTVMEKAAFNITYADGSSDTASTNTPAGAPATYQISAVPGQAAYFKYTAVNNGNSTQNITLLAPAVTGLSASSVKYYSAAPVDTNADGRIDATDLSAAANTSKEITSLKVTPAGDDPSTKDKVETNTGLQDFYLVYATPSVAKDTVVGATPIGQGQQWNGTANPDVFETATTLYYQYNKVTVQTASGVVGPSGFPAGDATATTYTSGSTTISELNDVQTAAPAKATTSVTFTNTLKNSGDQNDDFTLIVPPGGAPTGTTVTFLTSTGAAFNTTGQTVSITSVKNGTYNVTYQLVNGAPTIIGLQPGDSASYQTKVDYTNTPSAKYSVQIGVDSSKEIDVDPSNTADDQTTNVVNVPGVTFGNGDNNATTAPTDTAAPASGNPGQTVTFPLEIKNTGGSADTYYVTSSTLTFTVVDTATGAQTTVNVTPNYYPDADCNGVADSTTEITSSNLLSVAGGATSCVVMSVTIPAGATVQNVTFNETLKGTLVGDTALTVADEITVNLTNTNVPGTNTGGSGFAMAKFVEGGATTTPYQGITPPTGYGTGLGTGVVPGGTIRYVIIGKNTYNTTLSGIVLSDVLDANVNYAAATCAVYSLANTLIASKTCTASNVSGTVRTSGVTLASGEYVRVDLSVTVK